MQYEEIIMSANFKNRVDILFPYNACVSIIWEQ